MAKQQNRLPSLRITKHLQPLALHTIGFDEEDVDLRSMAAIRKREHLLRYVAVCQAPRHKGPLFGLRMPWGFYENGVGVACRNVRFPEQSQSNYWGQGPLGPERLSGNVTTPKAIQKR